ncbi:MAG: hypothetical protein AB7Q00_11690 [Phycisphaerales bacterium]|nr:MAG: hypothetical protein IPK69_01430 [Phycisphaerales bacterium]
MPNDSDMRLAGIIIFAVLALVFLAAYLRERSRRQAMALREMRMESTAPPPVPNDRDAKAFEQHLQLNDLAAQKMRQEIEMLGLQLQLAKQEVNARLERHDYHDAVMEKTRLEIESLKLHIKEQKKRLDEFGEFREEF